MLSETDIRKDKLDTLFADVLFIKIYTEMLNEFCEYFVKDYNEDSV